LQYFNIISGSQKTAAQRADVPIRDTRPGQVTPMIGTPE
jgi:hypothetical protein